MLGLLILEDYVNSLHKGRHHRVLIGLSRKRSWCFSALQLRNLFLQPDGQCLFDLLFRPPSVQVEQSVAVGRQGNVPARNLLATSIVRHKLH